MSRIVRILGIRARSVLSAAALALLASATLVMPAAAQDLPACEGQPDGSCRLPDWSVSEAGAITSPFGEVDGVVWLDDAQGDAPTAGLDVLSVGLGRVEVTDPAALRGSDALLKLGGRKKAVSSGPHILVRIVLDRPLSEIGDVHSGVHLATDVDGSRSNNAPAGVGEVGNPFVGSQDIYSLTYAATTGKSRLLKSDLAKGWYKAKQPYAAMWAAPTVLDILLPTQEFGDDFRVISYVGGAAGGYDTLDLDGLPIPSDGRVGHVASCIEASLSTQPFTVRKMVENGQTLTDVDAPASWRGGAAFSVAATEREALRAIVANRASDTGDAVPLASTVSLFEDGVVIRQLPDITLQLDGDEAQLSLELGLTRRGYSVLRDIELQPTGEAVADAWLQRATDTLIGSLPPFRLAKQAGPIIGTEPGSCVAALAPAAVPLQGPAESPGPSEAAESA